ncbi:MULTISPECIES: ParA family protein [Enterobacter cloacae complex]|uniref:ParA family protein n=1 Tax=Enterobacter cloacae complex TaxID=354276 RepID=UPI0029712E75|nr:AAA family ATPase [Enterobacter cloacae]HAV2102000.1 AAA family ATPase [Enterobacter cloacae]HAV2104114.1 AAA family ATPase [Enterobacter cloacae]HBM8916039.1 AAA family ATPase [Enterobacter cloacae]HBM8918144.1 AAA family ATPase [Enterobacter cloacae]
MTSESNVNALIERQFEVADGNVSSLSLPKFDKYTVCNLRGGIGKTSLTFNLSYLADDALIVDTCPQGNLSYFFDNNYASSTSTTANDLLMPYFVPGLGFATRAAKLISSTNPWFAGKQNYFIQSDSQLYLLPTQMANALAQARTITGATQQVVIDNILFSLKKEIEREMTETETTKALIDTSPFFSGATHLSWHATDALIVPVRTDQQSINSLRLLIDTLTKPTSEFRKTMPSDGHTPKIQMVVITHCGWSTVAGARNKPNQQTKMYIEAVREVIRQNISNFTTNDPNNHIVILDDFLGSGRMSSAKSKPLELLNPGDAMTVNRVRTSVNLSVNKIKNELKFIHNSIW